MTDLNLPRRVAGFNLPGLLSRHADLALGAALLSVLALLIVPVPPFMLDLFICASFSASLVMLCMTTYVAKAPELSSFPSLLLMTTMLRLAIAIASTRMILLHAHAGQIIDAFGQLVAGGNVAVGVVVFMVLSAIQFIVVAKGADRIAEVSARFTLDGIPGRQMSIDADLRNKVISPEQAARMRADMERETYFYGSLDGAMKFVKGDTIASFVVAIVNIVGGLAIGIGQRGMSFGDALHVYTILTIGDGLVSQVPSLIVSIASGLLVTRVTSTGGATGLGGEIYGQLSTKPRALLMAGACCGALALVPGFPHPQFALAAAGLAGIGVTLLRNARRSRSARLAPMPALARDGSRYQPRLLDDAEFGTSAALRLRLGNAALAALPPEALNRRIGALRRDVNSRLGVPFPGLAISTDERLEPERYIFDIDDVPYSSGLLVPGRMLVSGEASIVTFEGADGYRPGAQKAVWIDATAAASLDTPGLRKERADEALCAHLVEVVELNASRFVGTQETRFLLNRLSMEFREIVTQIEERITVVQLSTVLRQLLRQHVPIRNLRGILEAILRVPDGDRTVERMVRESRIELGPQIVRPYANLATWEIHAGVLDPAWESELEAQIRIGVDGEPECVLDYEQMETLRKVLGGDAQTVRLLVTTAVLRSHLARLLSLLDIPMVVLAIEEVPTDTYRVRTLAVFSPN